ncbi:hypothetical protein [Paenibacillus polymyxa]|nr:hypothetical protein [Paenibacillus sp. 1182]
MITPVLVPDDQEMVKPVETMEGAGVVDGVPTASCSLKMMV